MQNAEKNSFWAVFFIFFALGFAYIKKMFYLCIAKVNLLLKYKTHYKSIIHFQI